MGTAWEVASASASPISGLSSRTAHGRSAVSGLVKGRPPNRLWTHHSIEVLILTHSFSLVCRRAEYLVALRTRKFNHMYVGVTQEFQPYGDVPVVSRRPRDRGGGGARAKVLSRTEKHRGRMLRGGPSRRGVCRWSG